MRPSEPVQVALDHNFPTTLIEALTEWLPEVRLVPVRGIDERLPRLSDDDLVVALRQLGYGRMVTNDRMLSDPATLVAIDQARMTLCVIEGVGDDPVRATGGLFLDLVPALKKAAAHKSQILRIRPRAPTPEQPVAHLQRVAEGRGTTTEQIYAAYRRSYEELNRSLLDPELDW